MFEKIILRRSSSGPTLTIGELAEALLFYQNVHIVLDYGTLCEFVEKIRMESLLQLLRRKNISAVYCEETLAVSTTTVGAMQYHSFIGFMVSGNSEAEPANTRRKRLEQLLQRYGYDKRAQKDLAESFISLVPSRKLTDDYFVRGGVIQAAREDLGSQEFLLAAMRQAVFHTLGAPVLTNDFRFEVIPSGEDFLVFSNLDMDAINRSRKIHHPELGATSHAHLLSEFLNARADTTLAARYGGEFYTSELSSKIIRLRYADLLKRMGHDKEELEQLKDIILLDSPTIREVINSGERSFDEFLKLLDKSQRFRDWIQNVNPDEKLVTAYLSEVTSEGWISKLPGKTLRYALGSGVGAIGLIPGLIFSAADTFMVDKILGGWRPSHFVNNTLKPFVKE